MEDKRDRYFTERWFNMSPNAFGILVGSVVLVGAAYLEWCAEGPDKKEVNRSEQQANPVVLILEHVAD